MDNPTLLQGSLKEISSETEERNINDVNEDTGEGGGGRRRDTHGEASIDINDDESNGCDTSRDEDMASMFSDPRLTLVQNRGLQTSRETTRIGKKLVFGVTDVGEYIDNVYREQSASTVFGTLIGRIPVKPHSKRAFTASDIVIEGDMYKRGTWFKSWKKRYFILRKDIQSLCYFDNKESMTLLGSISLDQNTVVDIVDLDGCSNVLIVHNSDANPAENPDLVMRWESDSMGSEKIQRWWLEIVNEIAAQKQGQQSRYIREDWWTSLVASSSFLNQSRNSVANLTSSASFSKSSAADRHSVKSIAPEETNSQVACDCNSNSTCNPPQSDSSATSAPTSSTSSASGHASSTSSSTSSSTHQHNTPGKKSKGHMIDTGVDYIDKYLVDEPISKECPGGSQKLCGLQFSVRLMHLCAKDDKIYLSFSGSVPGNASTWENICYSEVRTVDEKAEAVGVYYLEDLRIQFNLCHPMFPSHFKKIKAELFKLEGNVDMDRSRMASMRQTRLCKGIFYPRDLDMNVCKVEMQPDKYVTAVDISMPIQSRPSAVLGIVKISSSLLNEFRCTLQRSLDAKPYAEKMYSFGTTSGLTLSHESLFASKYAVIASQVVIDLFHNERSPALAVLHHKVDNILTEAEAEIESHKSKSTHQNGDSDALLSELNHKYERLQQALRLIEDLGSDLSEGKRLISGNYIDAMEGNNKDTLIPIENSGNFVRRSVWKKSPKWQYCTTNLGLHLMSSQNFSFQNLKSSCQEENISKTSVSVPRESSAKSSKASPMMSPATPTIPTVPAAFESPSMLTPGSPTSSMSSACVSPQFNSFMPSLFGMQELHVIPTITLGVPAAHALKFHDGGLRRIFQGIPEKRRNLWMHAIQGPFGEDDFGALCDLFPRESVSLFGSSITSLKNGDSLNHAQFLAKKHEIATRLDICCSQILGFAVTSIRSIIVLAVKNGGTFFDVLARSLSIGFLVSLQSMLSTYGDEMGMMEDLEMATSWLGLLTIRFIQKSRPSMTNSSSKQILSSVHEKSKTTGGSGESKGNNDRGGLSLRRDKNKRLIVDIEVDSEEAAVIIAALDTMQNLHTIGDHNENEYASSEYEKIINITSGLEFSKSPTCNYSKYESPPHVLAAASIVGVAFTQGVNEMQTLASVSSHVSVIKQCEINNLALEKVKRYHRRYREAILSQCQKKESLRKMHTKVATAATKKDTSAHRLPHSRRLAINRDLSDKISNEGMSELARLGAESKRLLADVEEALKIAEKSPGDKHVHVLMKFSALCREMGGIIGILCKSGKDRTGMGVTLDITRGLVEDLGVTNGKEVCSLLRLHGVRRVNVYANTGQSLFAFNDIQRMALPVCFRPPHSTYSGKVNS